MDYENMKDEISNSLSEKEKVQEAFVDTFIGEMENELEELKKNNVADGLQHFFSAKKNIFELNRKIYAKDEEVDAKDVVFSVVTASFFLARVSNVDFVIQLIKEKRSYMIEFSSDNTLLTKITEISLKLENAINNIMISIVAEEDIAGDMFAEDVKKAVDLVIDLYMEFSNLLD